MSSATGAVPVIVGSGLAGLTVARALAPEPCILVTPGELTENAASMLAQGGVAAAVALGDSPALHAEDTWRAGAFAGDRSTIGRITEAAPGVVDRLVALGVPFDRTAGGALDLGLEGGHSRHRIVHAGDHSGATVTATVATHVAQLSSVRVLSRHEAVRLVLGARGAVAGVVVRSSDGTEHTIATDRVVLATGGLGGLFPHTTNPRSALGQGVAMAARAGARTDDLHLVQFHPTGLDVGRDPMPLITEALRGAGAVLLSNRERFVDELEPRDVVAAAVWAELTMDREVRLDARGIDRIEDRFPSVVALCAEAGLDPRTDLLPVRPTVHYAMGGVTTDASARTSVPGLYAVGEVSRTGLHGANRLASNSLLEAVVTGEAAAAHLVAWDGGAWNALVPPADPATVRPAAPGDVDLTSVRALLGASCGVLRDGATLAEATARLEGHTGDDAAYVAWLVARSALGHPHSVGAHRRTDDPRAAAASAPRMVVPA
jgi:L-aspartate oxidase